jgi:hypothetical protein
VTPPTKVLVEKENLMDYLKNEPVDVLATFGPATSTASSNRSPNS